MNRPRMAEDYSNFPSSLSISDCRGRSNIMIETLSDSIANLIRENNMYALTLIIESNLIPSADLVEGLLSGISPSDGFRSLMLGMPCIKMWLHVIDLIDDLGGREFLVERISKTPIPSYDTIDEATIILGKMIQYDYKVTFSDIARFGEPAYQIMRDELLSNPSLIPHIIRSGMYVISSKMVTDESRDEVLAFILEHLYSSNTEFFANDTERSNIVAGVLSILMTCQEHQEKVRDLVNHCMDTIDPFKFFCNVLIDNKYIFDMVDKSRFTFTHAMMKIIVLMIITGTGKCSYDSQSILESIWPEDLSKDYLGNIGNTGVMEVIREHLHIHLGETQSNKKRLEAP